MLKQSAGFSMIELMVSVAVSLIVVGAAIALYTTHVTANAGTIRTMRLNQELRSVLDLMVRDLRRASYRHGAVSNPGDPLYPWQGIGVGNNNYATTYADFAPVTVTGTQTSGTCATPGGGSATSVIVSGAEVRYLYDETSGSTGTLEDETEAHGFKLDGDTIKRLKITTPGGVKTENWEALTDNKVVEITALSFTSTACPIDLDGAGSSGNNVKIREIAIAITGRLKSDTSVVRQLSDKARLRNDQFDCPAPCS